MKIIKHFVLFLLLLLAVFTSLWFTPVPLAWQEKFVVHYYQFYFYPTPQWEAQHSFLEVLWVKSINLKLGYHWRDKTFGKLQATSPSEYPFAASVTYLKNHFITQQELPIDVVQTPTYASVVRGFGTCDQINGGLGLLLSSFCQQSELIELKNNEYGSHSLVRTQSPLGVVYADAFNSDNYYGFKEKLTLKGSQIIPLFAEKKILFNSKEYKEARVLTSYAFFSYLSNKLVKRNLNTLFLSYFSIINHQNQQRHYSENPTAMKLYLLARIAHLNEEQQTAKSRYQELLKLEAGLLKDCAINFLGKMK